MPKIDVVITNPPYTNGVHLKHLQRSYDVAERMVVCLHPMGWLHCQKPGRNSLKERADEIKAYIGQHFVYFRVLNGNKVFAIKYGQVCGITLIDKTKDKPEIDIDDWTINFTMQFPNAASVNPLYMEPAMFDPLRAKLWRYCASANIENQINQYHGDFYVNLPLISGHVDETGATDAFLKADFFQLLYDVDKKVARAPKTNKQNRWLSFATELEAQHCVDYLATSKLAKFCLMIVKSQQNLHRGELLYVPTFDFREPCPDEKLYSLLGLTSGEIEAVGLLVDHWTSIAP